MSIQVNVNGVSVDFIQSTDTTSHAKRTSDTQSPATNFNVILDVGNGQKIVLTPGRMTIGQFADAVGLSIINSNAATNKGSLQDLITNAALSRAASGITNVLRTIGNETNRIVQEETNYVNAQNAAIAAMNTAVTTFNSGVTQAINTYNQAINNYNNGLINQNQFNAIVNNYNSTIASLQANYNSAYTTFVNTVNANNQMLISINKFRAQFNIPPITPLSTSGVPSTATPITQGQNSPPLTVPIPSSALIAAPTPITSNLFPLQVSVDSSSVFKELYNLATTGTQLYNTQQKMHESNSDFYHFFLPGPRLNQLPAFVENIPTAFFNSGAGQSGSTGIAGATMLNINGDPAIAGALATGVFSSNQVGVQRELVTNAILFASQILTQAGLFSALPAARFLGTQALTAPGASTAFEIASGVAFSQTIVDFVNKNSAQPFVEQLVSSLGVDEKDNLVEFVTGQVNAYLLETALFVGALSLGSPGLVAQVNGNVSGILAPQNLSSGQVLNNNFSTLFLKSALSNALADTGVSKEKAAVIINRAVNQAREEGEIKESKILAALQDQGIANEAAQQIAARAIQIVQGEETAQIIQNGDLLDEQKIKDQLVRYGVPSQVAEQVITNIFKEGFYTNAFELQYALEKGLEKAGQTESFTVSSQTVSALNISILSSPLENPQPSSLLSLELLREGIHTSTYRSAVETLGAVSARVLADETVEVYTKGILGALERNKSESTLEVMRNFQAPTIDLFVFADQVRDPGKHLLYSMATGIMYNGMPEPKNYKKSIDIAA